MPQVVVLLCVYVCLCILFVPKYIRASLVQVSTISVKAALYTISMWLVYRWRGFLWHTAGVAHSRAWVVGEEGRVRG